MSLKINNLRKSFGENLVIKNFSYEFETKVRYGIVGKNGTGKTTVLKIIADLISLDYGEIFYKDKLNEHKKIKVSYVANNPRSFFMRLSCIENLYYFSALSKKSRKETLIFIEEHFSFFNISDFLFKPVNKISLGQSQIVNLMRGLLLSPEILLLDEIGSNLDEQNIKKIDLTLNSYSRSNESLIQISCAPQKDLILKSFSEIIEL